MQGDIIEELIIAVLIVLVGMSAASCYEPVSLYSDESPGIPYVHCVLSPDTTQWLEFRCIDAGSDDTHNSAVNEASVALYEVDEDGEKRFLKQFECIGDGLWRLDTRAKPKQGYYLRIERPGIDTIEAYTWMPDFSYRINDEKDTVFIYRSGLDMEYDHNTDVEYVEDLDNSYTFSVTTETQPYPGIPAVAPWYFFRVDPYNYKGYRFDRPRFHLSQRVDGRSAVWCYKVGWSESRGGWFVEGGLATNREDLADSFNLTGETFSASDTPEALSQFPDVAGKPLHYRFLRFPGGSLSHSDTVAVSGDFGGPHYGDARPGQVIEFEQAIKSVSELMGRPFNDNMFTTGHAGYVNFKFVSHEYDSYLKDVAGYDLLHEVGTDVVGIYSTTNIYTNIRGGVGVFGAEVDNKLYWSCGVWEF